MEPRIIHWHEQLSRSTDGNPQVDHRNCLAECVNQDGGPIGAQIGAGRKFFSRPVQLTFLAYANWSDGFRGLVVGTPFLKRTSGLIYGVQAETWW